MLKKCQQQVVLPILKLAAVLINNWVTSWHELVAGGFNVFHAMTCSLYFVYPPVYRSQNVHSLHLDPWNYIHIQDNLYCVILGSDSVYILLLLFCSYVTRWSSLPVYCFYCVFCRIRHCSSQSSGDSSSDSNGDDDVSRTLPGSAIRARKSAAAEAKVQEERHVSVWINCTEKLVLAW